MIVVASTDIASSSPWTRNVCAGGRVNPRSQRRISVLSACADIWSFFTTRAATGMTSPWIFDRGGAVHERTPARARGLVADEQHGVPRVGQQLLQVVQHAAARGHAAGRDDDPRRRGAGQGLGFLGVLDHVQPAHVEHRLVGESFMSGSSSPGRDA